MPISSRVQAFRAAAKGSSLRAVWFWMSPYKARMLLVVIGLSITSSIMLAVGPGLGWLINNGLFSSGSAGPELESLIGWALAATVVMVAGTWVRYYNISWLGERVAADMRQDVFSHLLNLAPTFFDSREGSDIQSRFTADTALLQSVIGSAVSVAARNFVMTIGGVIIMLVISPKLALAVVVGLALCVLPIIYFGRRVKAYSRATQDKVAEVGAEVHDTVQNIKTVHAFNRQAYHKDRLDNEVEGTFETAVRMIRSRASLVSLVIMLVMIALCVLVYIGGQDVSSGSLGPGDLVAFVFLAMVVAGSTGMLGEVIGDCVRALGAVSRLSSLLYVDAAENALRQLRADGQPDAPDQPSESQPLQPLGLSVRSLHFRYATRPEVEVLCGIDLDIEAGSYTAIVGTSGAGKTTLFDLFLRLYEWEKGEIHLGGVDIKSINTKVLRQRIGLVRQDSPMLRGSIYDNLRYGNLQASHEQLTKALRMAWADDFVRQLPDGWHTRAEGGKALSGGQRQRLAIARTLLAKPQLILLDEATSNLDSESEAMIRRALKEIAGQCTIVVIAHRLTTAREASKVVMMAAGKVVATGTHEELMRDCPPYNRLVKLQWPDEDTEENRAPENALKEDQLV